MRKVFVLSHGLSNGGSQRVASLIANELCEQGYSVTFIAAHSSEKTYELVDGVQYVYIGERKSNPLLSFWSRCRKLRDLIVKENPEVVISFIYEECLVLLPFMNKIKVIFTMRNAPVYFGKVQMAIMRVLYRKAHSVVFQTNDAKAYFDAKTQEHGLVIENPLSENLPIWNKDNCSKTIITACRLSEQKNLKMMCDAFEGFHRKHQDYKLVIYGKGPLEDELNDYITSKNLQNSIRIAGFVDDIHDRMANAEIFALSSDYEGISNSMIEALAIGIPTVCTDCPIGGARMLIDSYENGILVPVGDSKAMEQAFCYIAEHPQSAIEMSQRAQGLRERLNVKSICNKWIDLIRGNTSAPFKK